MLIERGCDPSKTDRYGNGVLHLAVIHNQPDMYYHALNYPENPPDSKKSADLKKLTGSKKSADPYKCNKKSLSPLALAAKLGKKEMFDKILEISSKRCWSYNTVTCSAYPLRSLDTIGDEGQTDWNSALMKIVQGRKNRHLDIVSNRVIKHLLNEKWRIFGFRKYVRLLVAFILHLACLTMAVYLRPTEQLSDLRYGTSGLDIARYVFESSVVLINFTVVVLAVEEIYLESFFGYWQNWFTIPTRVIYVISVILLLFCVPMRFLELYNIEEWLLVFAVPGIWSYSMFFLRINSHTGPLITIIFRIFETDVLRFAIIYVIILLTSALAFFYQFEGENTFAFLTELGTIMTLFQMSYGEFEERVVLGGKYQALTIIMFVVFMIVVHILLLNMLIAMVTRTFENITQQSEKVWQRQRAAMIVTMERSHSREKKLGFQEKYSVNIKLNSVPAGSDAKIDDQSHKLETQKKVKPPFQKECFVVVETNQVTKYENRALVVVKHQKMSVKQRKLNVKRRMFTAGQKIVKEAIPSPRLRVKSRAGYKNIVESSDIESFLSSEEEI